MAKKAGEKKRPIWKKLSTSSINPLRPFFRRRAEWYAKSLREVFLGDNFSKREKELDESSYAFMHTGDYMMRTKGYSIQTISQTPSLKKQAYSKFLSFLGVFSFIECY